MKKYQVIANGKPIRIKERFLRIDGDPFACNLEWAYVLANRTGGRVVDADGSPVKTLRHLMKGTLPEDVNLEWKEVLEKHQKEKLLLIFPIKGVA